MKVSRTLAASGLALLLSCSGFAQQTNDHANEELRKEAKASAQQQHKVDKEQAKADKADAKALSSRKVKKAAKQQDKANAAANATQPQ